ncbi:MAG: hypothetical protein A2189_07400 [Paenibacillus sp. RIFOXYA1_FULL_44_5]|nr:MAG: hypothetical protein A2189_07400 [Paenibacillus sp. RIFOXYA1_FULL_44_5]
MDPISETAKKYTEYDMIQKYTDLPEFPNFRAKLLYLFLDKCSQSMSASELFTLVTSLAQMGIDTHELVPNTHASPEDSRENRAKQLKILAGDYFSSVYYHLLAENGHVDAINLIAQAICEVNRLKMNVYTRMRQWKLTAEEYIQNMVHIKSQIFASFSKLMEENCQSFWSDMLKGLTKCEVIMSELKRMETAQLFHGGWAFWFIFQSASKDEKNQLQSADYDIGKMNALVLKYQVKSQLISMLDEQLKQILNGVHQFDSEKLTKDIYQISEPFLRYLTTPKVMEEV